MPSTIDEKVLSLLPQKPGVYIFKDAGDKILYVGKAKALKKRVTSYFQKSDHSARISSLVRKIKKLDYITTLSELEALILESNLIKDYKPQYNILLRDDKQYPYLKITMQEEFPRLLLVRQVKSDGAKYFGPMQGQTARGLINIAKKIFPIRWCKESPMKIRKQPCLEYFIKKCSGPCIDKINQKEYLKICKQMQAVLSGDFTEVLKKLQKQMEQEAKKKRFEKAAALRDKIRYLDGFAQNQSVVSKSKKNKDVFAIANKDYKYALVVLHIIKGKLVRKEEFIPKQASKLVSPIEFFENAIIQYYGKEMVLPSEIIVSEVLQNKELIKDWIVKTRNTNKVNIVIPKRGENKSLLNLAQDNAKNILFKDEKSDDRKENLLELQKVLHLEKLPKIIEAFDISNISGTYQYGSMVRFVNGIPDNKSYRLFKIRTLKEREINDVGAMYEVVLRRYSKTLKDKMSDPNLIVIDGGKGQLNAAFAALDRSGKKHIPMISLAKKEEEIFKVNQLNSIKIRKNAKALLLLQHLRDEAHRFGIKRHRMSRDRIV